MDDNLFEGDNEIFVDNEQETDKKDIRERLEEFSDQRLVSGKISEISSRATFLVANDVLEKLSDLVDYMEATSSLDSKLNEDKTLREIRDMRLYQKGFKSKFVGYALQSALDEYEADIGLIPETKRVRYKSNDGTYHRSFLFLQGNVLTLTTQNNRGHEVEYFTSNDRSEKELEDKFNEKVKLAESQSKK